MSTLFLKNLEFFPPFFFKGGFHLFGYNFFAFSSVLCGKKPRLVKFPVKYYNPRIKWQYRFFPKC